MVVMMVVVFNLVLLVDGGRWYGSAMVGEGWQIAAGGGYGLNFVCWCCVLVVWWWSGCCCYRLVGE